MNTLAATAVQRLFDTAPAARYIDVRTVAEFAQGRPLLRAVNLPFVFHAPQRTAEIANDSFVELVAFLYPTDTPLVLGGDADTRAARAATLLDAAGFAAVALLDGGLPAWRAALLPTTRDNRDGVSYVSLLTRYRRRARAEKDPAAAS